MLLNILSIVLVVMSLTIFVCFIRVLKGPSMADRVLALDTIGINLIGMIGIVMVLQKTIVYAEVILVIAIISFVGSVALAKFIERGVVIDRDHH